MQHSHWAHNLLPQGWMMSTVEKRWIVNFSRKKLRPWQPRGWVFCLILNWHLYFQLSTKPKWHQAGNGKTMDDSEPYLKLVLGSDLMKSSSASWTPAAPTSLPSLPWSCKIRPETGLALVPTQFKLCWDAQNVVFNLWSLNSEHQRIHIEFSSDSLRLPQSCNHNEKKSLE